MKHYLWVATVALIVSAHASENPFNLNKTFEKLDAEQDILLLELKQVSQKQVQKIEVVKEPSAVKVKNKQKLLNAKKKAEENAKRKEVEKKQKEKQRLDKIKKDLEAKKLKEQENRKQKIEKQKNDKAKKLAQEKLAQKKLKEKQLAQKKLKEAKAKKLKEENRKKALKKANIKKQKQKQKKDPIKKEIIVKAKAKIISVKERLRIEADDAYAEAIKEMK